MTKLVYRAIPIDSVGAHKIDRLRDGVDYAIQLALGTILFKPESAFQVSPNSEIDGRIEGINRDALGRADGLVAVMPPNVPTLGVGREIEAARALGIPVLIVSMHRTWSGHDCAWADLDQEGDVLTNVVHSWVAGLSVRSLVPEATRDLLVAPDEGCEGLIPARSHAGDAGFDLFVAQDTFVGYDEFVDVSCGVRIALPAGTWGRITGRSSTLRKRGLLVIDGVIDNGYRGPIFAGVRNMTKNGVKLARGERVAQLIFHDLVTPRYTPMSVSGAAFEAIPHDGRGASGFGSTGV